MGAEAHNLFILFFYFEYRRDLDGAERPLLVLIGRG